MSHSLTMSKYFTADQNKDAHSAPKSWPTDRVYCDYKEQPHVLDDLHSKAESAAPPSIKECTSPYWTTFSYRGPLIYLNYSVRYAKTFWRETGS